MLVLLMFTTYVLLDTFVIAHVYGVESASDTEQETAQVDSSQSQDSQDGSSMADQIESDGDDLEAGNMHSGQSDTGGAGAGSGDRSGEGHGPSGHSGKGPGKHRDASGSADSSGSSDSTGYGSSDSQSTTTKSSASTGSTSDSYSDGNITIKLWEYRENDTTIYVADVLLESSSLLKTALAQGAYGKNVTQKTSEIAESVNAILAINGDFYGAQEKGYVIRNGTLYRDSAIANQEDLVIYKDGSFGIINESNVTAKELIAHGAVQTLSFGPALVQNGEISVTQDEEVGKAMASNPRTAIGIIDENHYVFVVSDGRTSESTGLSLHQLAEFMDSLGVETAYNLDGGGSSTMYFNGNVVNNPTTGGSTTRERSVSDIVYIGSEK